MSSIRSREQLLVLLKFMKVNNLDLTRRNVSVRHKMWQIIADKLNDLNGAQKDVDGWKRTYYSWRINMGPMFEKEMEKLIEELSDDDEYYTINVSDEEDKTGEENKSVCTYKNPKESQMIRLNGLISKHKDILQSNANDEPLKKQIWINIAKELNGIPGGQLLAASEWAKRVDWGKFQKKKVKTRRRGSLQKKTEKILSCFENDIENSIGEIPEAAIDVHKIKTDEDESQNSCDVHKLRKQEEFINCDDIEGVLNTDFESLDTLLNDDIFSNEDLDFEPILKRFKTNKIPIVKDFKYSERVVNTVEGIQNDIQDIKSLLTQTNNNLCSLIRTMEQNNKTQSDTNVLLKRNVQLLKLVAESQFSRRSKATN